MRRFGSWELLEVRRLLAADGYHHYSPPAESEVFEDHEVADTGEESPDPQQAGSLTGFKVLDANRDRIRNVEASSDSLFVLLLDASESSRQPFGVSSYSRLEAQSIAIQEFQRELVRRGLGEAKLAVTVLGNEATPLDLDPFSSGVQVAREADADTNRNRIPDLFEALGSVQSGGETVLEAAVTAASATIEGLDLDIDPSATHVVFLTDGFDSSGELSAAALTRLHELAGTIRVFAVAETDLNALRQIDPNALAFADLRDLRMAASSLQITAGIDFTERGIAGIKIFLDQNFNCLIDPGELVVTTQADDLSTLDVDETGRYVFEDLPLGTYVIREEMRAGVEQTWPVAGAYTVRVRTNELERHGLGFDFGNRAYLGGIRGVVFQDVDRDGVFDASEVRIAGVLVYLDVNGDGTFDAGEPSRTTSASGNFEFLALAVGLHGVRIIVPASLEQVFPSAGTGHARIVDDQVVEVTFGLAPPVVIPPPIQPTPPPVVDLPVISSLTEPATVRPIQPAGPLQTEAPPFIGAGGGEVLPTQATSPERSTAAREPWLQAIELDVEELLPALAEVMSSGIFEADPGDPPPPLRRVKDAKITGEPTPHVVHRPESSGDPSSDDWSMWWWSLAPVTALAGGLWWRFGPSVPWRSTAQRFGWRVNSRMK